MLRHHSGAFTPAYYLPLSRTPSDDLLALLIMAHEIVFGALPFVDTPFAYAWSDMVAGELHRGLVDEIERQFWIMRSRFPELARSLDPRIAWLGRAWSHVHRLMIETVRGIAMGPSGGSPAVRFEARESNYGPPDLRPLFAGMVT